MTNSIIGDYSNGWLTFKLGDYRCSASYLNRTPEDILDACINFYKTSHPQVVKIDEEELGETILIIDRTCCIIKDDKCYWFDYEFSAHYVAQAIVNDIIKDIDKIVDEFYCGLYGSKRQATKRLTYKYRHLNKLIKEGYWWIKSIN